MNENAKKLSDLLNNVQLINPELELVGKIGFPNSIQLHLIECKSKGKFLFEYGATTSLDFILSKDEAFGNMSNALIILNCKLKFHRMTLPNHSSYKVSEEIFEKVYVRLIEYYEIRLDEILTRYDILIEKIL